MEPLAPWHDAHPDWTPAPTPAEVAHVASILMWRDWWGRRKLAGELLPLWLVNRGYPILHDVVARGVVRNICRHMPREIMFGDKSESRKAWADDLVEESAAAKRTSHRGDSDRVHFVDELTHSIVSDTVPGGPAVGRAQARRKAQDQLNSGLHDFLMHVVGEPAGPDFHRFVGDILGLGTVYGETDPDEVLSPQELIARIPRLADIVALLEGEPPMASLLQETRQCWLTLSQFAFLKTKKGLATADEYELLLQVFLAACSYRALGIGPGA